MSDAHKTKNTNTTNQPFANYISRGSTAVWSSTNPGQRVPYHTTPEFLERKRKHDEFADNYLQRLHQYNQSKDKK